MKISAQTLILFALCALCLCAQANGNIDDLLAPVQQIGVSIIKLWIALVGLALIGVMLWGCVTLGTNRPRGLAMIAGGLVGSVGAGLSIALVNRLTGGSFTIS